MKQALPLLNLCRHDGHTCGGCCWGSKVQRPVLAARLRRQTLWFRCWFGQDTLPPRWALCLYEIAARGGLDLLLAPLLFLPGVGDLLRRWVEPHIICAFLAFEDDEHERIGCRLHPTRWHGREVRPETAFGLLKGIACGEPAFFCQAAYLFRHATWQEQQRFAEAAAGMDWFTYSEAALGYRPGRYNLLTCPAGSPD